MWYNSGLASHCRRKCTAVLVLSRNVILILVICSGTKCNGGCWYICTFGAGYPGLAYWCWILSKINSDLLSHDHHVSLKYVQSCQVTALSTYEMTAAFWSEGASWIKAVALMFLLHRAKHRQIGQVTGIDFALVHTQETSFLLTSKNTDGAGRLAKRMRPTSEMKVCWQTFLIGVNPYS